MSNLSKVLKHLAKNLYNIGVMSKEEYADFKNLNKPKPKNKKARKPKKRK